MVPPASHRIPRARWYSGFCRLPLDFVYGTFTLSGITSQLFPLSPVLPSAVRNPSGIATSGLASFHFARRYFENRSFFLFLRLLRCFSSAGSPGIPMFSVYRDGVLPPPDSSIRISAGLWIFAPLRSFSQLVTSFVGS